MWFRTLLGSGCGSGPSQEVFKHMLQCTPHNSVAVVIVSCWPTMSVLCKKWSHPRRTYPTRQVDMVWAPSQEVFKHMLQCTPHNSVAVVIVSCWPTMSVLCMKWSHPRRKWLETRTTSHVMEWPTHYSVCFVSANNESLIFPLVWLPCVEWPP